MQNAAVPAAVSASIPAFAYPSSVSAAAAYHEQVGDNKTTAIAVSLTIVFLVIAAVVIAYFATDGFKKSFSLSRLTSATVVTTASGNTTTGNTTSGNTGTTSSTSGTTGTTSTTSSTATSASGATTSTSQTAFEQASKNPMKFQLQLTDSGKAVGQCVSVAGGSVSAQNCNPITNNFSWVTDSLNMLQNNADQKVPGGTVGVTDKGYPCLKVMPDGKVMAQACIPSPSTTWEWDATGTRLRNPATGKCLLTPQLIQKTEVECATAEFIKEPPPKGCPGGPDPTLDAGNATIGDCSSASTYMVQGTQGRFVIS